MNSGNPTGSVTTRPVLVDSLCLASLLRIVVSHGVSGSICIHYFKSTVWGLRFSSLVSRLAPLATREMDYSIVDVQDPDGGWSAVRVWSLDVRDLSREIVSRRFSNDSFVRQVGARFSLERLLIYLGKGLSDELIPRLMQIKVASWMKREMGVSDPVSLYTTRCLWAAELIPYAEEAGITLRSYFPIPTFRFRFRVSIAKAAKKIFRVLPRVAKRLLTRRPQHQAEGRATSGSGKPKPVVALSYSGQGLTQDLSRNSDLFWFPYSDIDPEQLLVYFVRTDDALDEERYARLQAEGIRCVALGDGAATWPGAPRWPSERSLVPRLRLAGWVVLQAFLTLTKRPCHLGWCLRQSLTFSRAYAYWSTFFKDHNVSVNVNFVDWFAERVASDQALHDLGGISVSYQRSDESLPWLQAGSMHVHFAFSPNRAVGERAAGSYIQQFVSAGYVHDHAFNRVGERSAAIRDSLAKAGASFVICYFDEGSAQDKRDNVSHAHAAENYRYLLSRLLEDPGLGLIFKPKKPSTLRTRLGDEIAALLDRALATGRCVLMEGGIATTPELPCEPAGAADLCIGLLFGATATLEGRLSGTPGVLLDRERVTYHPLRELGEGTVVFNDWESLWRQVVAYRGDPESVTGFGDWDALLPSLDPYQDGRAADRMGTYIGSLVSHLSASAGRDEAMALTAGHYTRFWGEDKVLDLRGPGTSIGHEAQESVRVLDTPGLEDIDVVEVETV